MKPNPEAIKALKRVMTKEQRKLFVDNCIKDNGKDFLKNCNLKTVIISSVFDPNDLINEENSFDWIFSGQGLSYWSEIFHKLTQEERALKLFIK